MLVGSIIQYIYIFFKDWKTVNVSDVSREEYMLGSLKPYTYYLAFIRVHTLSGWSGNSDFACEMTMPTGMDGFHFILFLLLSLFVMCVCLYVVMEKDKLTF